LHGPGDKWTYGASTRVLGLVVEKISGQPLDQFFQTSVFEPLGMDDTAFVVPAENASRVVTLHRRTDDGLIELPNPSELKNPAMGDSGSLGNATILTRESVMPWGKTRSYRWSLRSNPRRIRP
jgi:CubicO group peptidase (beta-lactamase class C family)